MDTSMHETPRTEPWRDRFERLWREAGVPPGRRPVVSERGTPAEVEARRWASLVASASATQG